MKHIAITLMLAVLVLAGCQGEENSKPAPKDPTSDPAPKIEVNHPEFRADSAYAFIARQLNFGYRVPGTEAHQQTADWLRDKFAGYTSGKQVQIQNGRARLYNNKVIDLQNIIAEINPQAKQRVLLCAHWDSRMMADHASQAEMQDEPVPGANDGASGVGVLLEVARILKQQPLQNLGIDIVLFDAEDQGTPDNKGYRKTAKSAETWALGAQFWANNPHRNPGRFRYGILLDMVGAKNATFPREQYSMKYAPHVVNKVWDNARELGYGDYFINQQSSGITDDHYFINTIISIPTIDIIHYDANTNSFFPEWHTPEDDLDVISKQTLQAVGQTLLRTIYKEDAMM